jgi:hypothetical protein
MCGEAEREKERDRGGITSLRLTQEKRSFTHSPAVNMGRRRCRPEEPRGRPMTIHASGNSDSSVRGSTLGTSDHVHLSILVNSLENRQTHCNFWTDSTARLCKFVILLSFGDRGPLCVALSLVGAIITAPLDLLNLVFNPPIKPSCDSFTCE